MRTQQPQGLRPSELSSLQRSYYWASVLTLLICWSPSNALAYMMPLAVLGWLLVATRKRALFERAGLWVLGWGIFAAFHALFDPDYVWVSALIALMTYATLAFVFIVPSKWLANPMLLTKMLKWVRPIIVIEALWGIVQAGYGVSQTGSLDISNGDFVEGTIHPSLQPELAFSNVMFAANIAFLLLFLLPYVLRQRYVFTFILGCVALILASVVHVLFFFILSLSFVFLIYRPKPTRKTTLIAGLILLLLPLIGYAVLTTNFGTAIGFAKQIVSGEVPRSLVVLRAIHQMPLRYPCMPLFGLGPGQFSSRAGLIGTGLYFGGMDNPKPLPLITPQISTPQQEYLMDLWRWHFSRPAYGSTQAPYFSWLSIFTEFGIFAVIIILLLGCKLLLRLKRSARCPSNRVLAMVSSTGIVFTLLLGGQENYWEVPQAVFVGVMLLKIVYANAVYSSPRTPSWQPGSKE